MQAKAYNGGVGVEMSFQSYESGSAQMRVGNKKPTYKTHPKNPKNPPIKPTKTIFFKYIFMIIIQTFLFETDF